MLLFLALKHFPSSPPLSWPQWHFLSEDEYVQHLPPSPCPCLPSLSPSRSQPISLCLSLCHSQPITGWLQVLNPRPRHQLAHYIAALNLSLVPSGSLFLSIPVCHFVFFLLFLLSALFLTLNLSYVFLLPLSPIVSFFFLSLSSSCQSCFRSLPPTNKTLILSTPSFSFLSIASLSPSPLWPPHSANCYNSIVPSLPVGSNGINKAGFEMDFLSAPFWITLVRGFGSEHSSSCCLSQYTFSLYPSCWRTTALTMADVAVSFYSCSMMWCFINSSRDQESIVFSLSPLEKGRRAGLAVEQ